MAVPVVDKEYLDEIEKARRDLRAHISNKSCAPLMLRLALRDAVIHDVKTKKELKHDASKDLAAAIDLYEEVKKNHSKITYADLRQLAGVVAVEITGGPTIDFVPGRKEEVPNEEDRKIWDIYFPLEATGEPSGAPASEPTRLEAAPSGAPASAPPSGAPAAPTSRSSGAPASAPTPGAVTPLPKEQLPDANQDVPTLRKIFSRMGLSDQHIVAVAGGHALGRRVKGSGSTAEPLNSKFDNSYFSKLQQENKLDGQMNLPMDKALVDNPSFWSHVQKFSKDEASFLKEYVVSHKKISEYCVNTPSYKSILTQTAVGVAIAATVVILSYFFVVRRRIK